MSQVRPQSTSLKRHIIGEAPVTETMPLRSRYTKSEKLGAGAYGTVYKAQCNASGNLVALKRVRLDHSNDGVPATTIREIACLRGLGRHPNVLSLLDVESAQSAGRACLHIITDLLDMDLATWLHKETDAPSGQLLRHLAHQMLAGLDFCHTHQILHRDLKPQNVLVKKSPSKDQPPTLVLADFGLGRCVSHPHKPYTHEVVTLWYRPPEILLGGETYKYGVDTWAVGCIFAELAMKTPLFPGYCEIEQLMRIFEVMGTPTEKMWPGVSSLKDFSDCFPAWKPSDLALKLPALASDPPALDLFKALLAYNPDERMPARKALEHKFFDDYQPPGEAKKAEGGEEGAESGAVKFNATRVLPGAY